MNTNQPFEKDESLRKVLSEWRVDAALPPRFQECVWHRIDQTRKRVKAIAWQNFTVWFETVFRRPALAFSFVVILLFVGLTAGFWAGHNKTEQAQSHWRALYVQSVDPYQALRH